MLLVIGIGGFLAAGIYLFGRRRPAYSHLRHTISELGERGASDARVVSWGFFFPVGVSLAAISLLYREAAVEAAGLAGAIAIG